MKNLLIILLIAGTLMALVPNAEAKDRRYRHHDSDDRYYGSRARHAPVYVVPRYTYRRAPVYYRSYRSSYSNYYDSDCYSQPYYYSRPRTSISFSFGR